MRKHIERAVSDLIELFVRRAKEGELALGEPAKLLAALRPLGLEAVRIIVGRAMENGLRKLVESGVLAGLSRKVKRRRR